MGSWACSTTAMRLDGLAPLSPPGRPTADAAAAWSAQLLPGVMPSAPGPQAETHPAPAGGVDPRRPVPTVLAPPWQRVCHLLVQGTSGQWVTGTGWLGGPATVYTAGHTLWNARAGHRAVRVWVVPGRDGAVAPHGQFEAAGFEVHPQWKLAETPQDDVGVVWLAQPLGRRLGWFGFSAQPDAVLQGLSVQVSGYPDDRLPFGSPWCSDDVVHRAGPRMLAYGLDTRPAQGGSPVFAANARGDAVVLGVHVHQVRRENLAVRIDRPMFDTLSAWWR